MLEELKTFFLRNISALRRTHPELADRIESRTPSTQFHWVSAESGSPTLLVDRPNRPFYLHSRKDPIQEASREVQSLSLNAPSVLIFLGLGLGYSLEQVWESQNRMITGLLIIERDADIFYAFLHRRDWSELLSNPRVRIVISNRPEKVQSAAHSLLPQIMGSGVRFMDHRPSSQLYSEFYSQSVQYLRQFLQQAVAESEFLVHNGALIQRNAILNLPAMCTSCGLGPLRDFFKDLPAVLIAAGPSLNKNLHELERYRGDLIIFCVDTAYRILQQQGIRPDFIASTDPTELNEKHFEGLQPDPSVVLLFESDVFPTIPQRWLGPTIFLNSEKAAINRWIEDTAGPFGTFDQSLSVAHALYTAAFWMGCDPIILIGYDLAYPADGGATHAQGAVLNRKIGKSKEGDEHIRIQGASFHPEETQEEIVWVLSVRGGMVPTSKTMAVFLNKLAATVLQTNKRVFDATEGGALIEGTIPARLADLLPSLEKRTIQGDILHFLKENQDPEDMNRVSAFNQLIEGLRQAQSSARQGKELVCQLLPQASSEPGTLQASKTQAWNQVDEIFWDIYRNCEVQVVLEQALFSSLFIFIRQEPNDSEKRRLEKYDQYFKAVNHYSQEFIHYLQHSQEIILQNLQ